MPFYAGITLEEIGGRGVRWLEREDVRRRPPGSPPSSSIPPARPPPGDGKLRLGTYRPLWAAKEVDLSPALHFIRARQVAELSPADAAALGISEGDRVSRSATARRVHATVRLRDGRPGRQRLPGRGHARGQRQRAHAGPLVESTASAPAPLEPSAVAAQIQPAVEGLAEMPPSAPPADPAAGGDLT